MAKKHFKEVKDKIKKNRKERVNPHKSFERSYREDYARETETPGVMLHIFAAFKMIFGNWKLFLPLIVIIVVLNVLFVGAVNEANYVEVQNVLDRTSVEVNGENLGWMEKAGLLLVSAVTTGGFAGGSGDVTIVIGVLVFLVVWLTTIFIVRHRMAGHKIKLRDGLYNAMTPLVSTFVVLAVVVIQCVPIFILIVAFSAAVKTEFLATPFYALMFWVFAGLMMLLSGYLLSSSLIALVAVSAPGLYPLKALYTASDLMMGRRLKLVIRLIALALTLVVIWVVVMLPIILFDLFMKQFTWTAGVPLVPICLTAMTCFSYIYATVYLYLYYRWLLDEV